MTRKDPLCACVRVRDTGAGIAPELLEHVFELFAQAHTAKARNQGGLGIGLSLVRGLVELHGGTVLAKSDGPGMGSEFTVRLPISRRGGRASEHTGRRAPTFLRCAS